MFIPEQLSTMHERHPEEMRVIMQKLKQELPTLIGYEVAWSSHAQTERNPTEEARLFETLDQSENQSKSQPSQDSDDHRLYRFLHLYPHLEQTQIIAFLSHRKVKKPVCLQNWSDAKTSIPLNCIAPSLKELSHQRNAHPYTNFIWCDWDLHHLGWTEVQWVTQANPTLTTNDVGTILYGVRGFQTFILIKHPVYHTWHNGVDLHLTEYVTGKSDIPDLYKNLRKMYPMELLRMNILNPHTLIMDTDFPMSPLTPPKTKYIQTSRSEAPSQTDRHHTLISSDYSAKEWLWVDRHTKFIENSSNLTLEERTNIGKKKHFPILDRTLQDNKKPSCL